MIESFVDLGYRGLALGRRVKLAQVRPSTGYIELHAPMPVGTQLEVATEEGVVLAARVVGVHEQVAGSDRAPGMLIAPVLTEDKASLWWQARVTLPDLELPKRPTRERPVTVRPRSRTIPHPQQAEPAEPPPQQQQQPEPVPSIVLPAPAAEQRDLPRATTLRDDEPAGAYADDSPELGTSDEARPTVVMEAVDQELLSQLSRPAGDESPVIDDGRTTTVMTPVDEAALGIEVSASGTLRMVHADDDEDDGADGDDTDGDGGGPGDDPPINGSPNGSPSERPAASSTSSSDRPSKKKKWKKRR